MMDLVVIDTNVWLSGLFWRGIPSKILQLVYQEQITACFSSETFDEWDEKVARLAQVTTSEDLYLRYRKFLQKFALFVQPTQKVDVCRDPHDNMFLEAALAGQAQFIISGDKDLLILKSFHLIKIVTPKQYLEKLGK